MSRTGNRFTDRTGETSVSNQGISRTAKMNLNLDSVGI